MCQYPHINNRTRPRQREITYLVVRRPIFYLHLPRASPLFRRSLTRATSAVAYLTERPIMFRKIDLLTSASRGTLAGDLLWLGTISFM